MDGDRAATPTLRPRGIFALIDSAFTVSASEPAIVWISILGMAPVALLSLVLWYGATEAAFDERTELLVALACAAAALWRYVPGGAVSLLVMEQVSGRPLAVRDALRQALGRAPSLMAAGSLSLWVTLLSLLVAGLPLVAWAGVYLALPLVLRRDCPPWGVVGAGRKLLRDRVTAAALLTALWFSGVCLLAANLWLAVSLGLSLGASLFDLDTALLGRLLSPANPIFLPAVGAIALTLLEGLRHTSLTLLYLDARVRRDALDLEAQVSALEDTQAGRRPGSRPRASRVAGLLALVGLGAALAGGPASARAQGERSASSVADRFIDVANEAIDRGAAVDTELAEEVLGSLDAQAEQALAPLTEQLQRDLDEGAIGRAEARLERAFEEMEYLADQEPVQGEPVDRLLTEVLARPEFQRETRARLTGRELEEEPEKRETWLSRLLERFFDWLEELFERDPKERDEPLWDGPLLPANLSWLLWAALLTVAGVGIGVAVVRALGATEEELEEELGSASEREEEEDEVRGPQYDALSRAPDAWLAEADALAARGELREALRAAYLALLGILDRAGHIAYRSEQTNWEHVRGFDGPEVARKRFHELTYSFERSWYGFDPVELHHYRTVREGALDLASLSPQRPVAGAEPVGGEA
ncbi:MAG: hypothetical protein P1V51_00375 [Deltaproteobacteria bacterium]|nr:hypothetical protein [Deltaproteobacteria bacterium]